MATKRHGEKDQNEKKKKIMENATVAARPSAQADGKTKKGQKMKQNRNQKNGQRNSVGPQLRKR